MKVKKIIIICGLLTMVCGLTGCDAFVRKFTRKPKKQDLPPEEMVLTPQEYQAPQMSQEDQYRKYLLYWKSWQNELINFLSESANHKKQLDCAREAIENLQQLRPLLSEDKQKKLDGYINQMIDLESSIDKDISGFKVTQNRLAAERIRMNILRDFSYNKINSAK